MKHFSIMFILVVLFALVSTSSAQTYWTKETLFNPVLNPGPSGAWDEEWIRVPTVIFDGTTYYMWYCGRNSIQCIGYATSTDGITWIKYDDPTTTDSLFAESDPILNPGEPGEWDSQQVSSPSVIRIDTTYHMWYRGKDNTIGNGPASIGHAMSNDGISWEKDTLHNPVLTPGPAGSWDGGWIGYQSVLFDGTIYHLWYAGTGMDAHVRIGHATAPHPDSTWMKDPDNPVLSFGAPGSWDYPRVDGPSVVYDGNIFHMWYSGGDLFTWSIGYATSPDGSNWEKDTLNNPVLIQGTAGSWDDTWVGFCSVIDSANSKYKMWYSGGNTLGGGHIGYADAPVTGIKVLNENLPNGYMLQQNYPNPFNPTTNIEFSIPKSEFVSLKVYNILGEEVATLVSDKLSAGSYSYEWSRPVWPPDRTAGISSGVYLYRMKAGEFVETKKMILMR